MISPGKIIYQVYFKPLNIIRQTLRTGVRRTAEMNTGKKQMVQVALGLKEVCYANAETYHVYFLTGKKYWYQTAFCLHSLQRVAGVNIRAVIVDDGSFDNELEHQVNQQFPNSTEVIRSGKVNELLDAQLPQSQFPVLRSRRLVYPHLRKLTDVHVLPSTGPKLVLDSDMLFFQKPVALLNWLAHPIKLLFMQDVVDCYGYSHSLMKELTGVTMLPHRLNVGVAGMPSQVVNWKQLEYWTDELLKKEGSSYLQEQALTAMIAAREEYFLLDENEYKVLPSIQAAAVSEKLHHYVAEAKYDYFVKGWKIVYQHL